MSDPQSPLASPSADDIAEIGRQLPTASPKKQLQLIAQLAQAGEPGLDALMAFLQECDVTANPAAGKAYQTLYQAETPAAQQFLAERFPEGMVPLRSQRGVDYSPIQQALAQQAYQSADRLTREKLCELAGPDAVGRQWLYFTEVNNFPTPDLQTVDELWLAYSEGKFGYSVQRQIWLSVGQAWEKLWPKIGWKSGRNWTRYPDEFVWDLSAPRGHLPLSNQLRGARVLISLLTHPAVAGE